MIGHLLERWQFMSTKRATMWSSLLLLLPFNSSVNAFQPSRFASKRLFLLYNSDIDGFFFGDSIPSDIRAKRLQHEEQSKQRFVRGEDLAKLRSDVATFKENLKWAQAMGDESRVLDLEKAIEQKESRDPDFVYSKALNKIDTVFKAEYFEGKDTMIDEWKDEARAARSCIPRFNLEGLWVGNYGDNGYELVNVTYKGDTLIATKATGDKHVSRHQVTFEANLAPPANSRASMAPIELTNESAAKWGLKKLERYPGQGHIAATGFTGTNFVEGQFIMFEDHFSFVWVPSRHHVFFGRPSPQVTMRLLRDVIAKEDELDNMRFHLEQSYEMDFTESLARASSGEPEEPFRRIPFEEELNRLKMLEPAMRTNSGELGNIFWNFQRWIAYIENALSDDKGKNS